MQIREYLARKGIQYQVKNRNGRVEGIMNCPFCGDKDKKGAINLETGAYNCLHANSCGLRLSWWDFQKQFGDDPVPLDGDKIFYPPIKREWKKPSTQVEKPKGAAIVYLKSRGFTFETIKKFNFGEKNGAIMIPYYKDGELVNIKYRSIKEKKMWSEKDAEPVLFNRDRIKPDTDELVISEGEMDCAALDQYNIPAVSVPNGVNDFRWVENEWEWLERFTTIYVCFDNDEAGRKGLQELVTRLGLWRCKAVTLPKKDANECLKAGISRAVIVDAFVDARDFKPVMLASPADFIEEVIDFVDNPKKLMGIPTGFKKLDDILGGWRDSELTIWSGRNSAGKSTILNQIFLSLAEREIKTCIASLEMRPQKYLRWAVLQNTGKKYPASDVVRKTLEWLTGRMYLINTIDTIKPTDLLDVFEYAARKYGVKHFLIDSLMKIDIPSKEELVAQKEFVSRLSDFSDKFKCHIHLVAHPRKGWKDNDRPGKVDVMGTGHITNLADNVLIIYRIEEEEKKKAEKKNGNGGNGLIPDAILYIKKNRELGREGSIKLFYNAESKTYQDDVWG